MNDHQPPVESAVGMPGETAGPPESGFGTPRLSRLAMKELRETLRDRRTIVTLILMPLLVYPILSLVFRTFLFNSMDSLRPEGPETYNYVIDGDAGSPSWMRSSRGLVFWSRVMCPQACNPGTPIATGWSSSSST